MIGHYNAKRDCVIVNKVSGKTHYDHLGRLRFGVKLFVEEPVNHNSSIHSSSSDSEADIFLQQDVG